MITKSGDSGAVSDRPT